MTTEEKLEKVARFAQVLETQQKERLREQGLACEGNLRNCHVSVKEGNKYIRVDVGDSGKYMVDQEGNIFGIKAYGVIHRGHRYGTLDTTDQYFWGDYHAYRKYNGE